MFDTTTRGIVFMFIFCIGLILMIFEGEFGETTRLYMICGIYILPTLLVVWFIVNRQMWPKEKKKYLDESFRSAFICSITVIMFIPTLNRIIPPTVDVHIVGEVLSIKPGIGTRPDRGRETKIREKNGNIITLVIPNTLYQAAITDGLIRLKCKRGGFGLLYNGEKET
jgi:hypothetical protein